MQRAKRDEREREQQKKKPSAEECWLVQLTWKVNMATNISAL